jgi:hypothetical protein
MYRFRVDYRPDISFMCHLDVHHQFPDEVSSAGSSQGHPGAIRFCLSTCGILHGFPEMLLRCFEHSDAPYLHSQQAFSGTGYIYTLACAHRRLPL